MSSRVSINEFDFETKVETITTTWPNGSTIITKNDMNDLMDVKTEINIFDASSGKGELVEHLVGNSADQVLVIEIMGIVNDWYEKFNDDVEK